MTAPRILIFDSGMGGLTVSQAVARQIPDACLIYAADNAAFPYGGWAEAQLVERIRTVMARLIDAAHPDLVVVACNTASTIALADLRAHFSLPFVGTVPAIKPAAAQTKTGVIGVLATPGTVKREYTQVLIQKFASNCHVVLHGAPRLAQMVEAKLGGGAVDLEALRSEIAPVFAEHDRQRTDIVVLACTHYPLMTDEFRAVAPWPVTYLDPAPAIARRVADVAEETARGKGVGPEHGTVMFTSAVRVEQRVTQAYAAMGFTKQQIVDIPR